MIQPEALGVAALALGAGAATFFSPCAYALLPGYVGFYVAAAEDGDRVPLASAVGRGLAATLGAVGVIAALAAVVLVVGEAITGYLDLLEPVVGVVLILFGLLVVLDRGPTWHARLPARRRSVAGFVVFGAGYAVAAAGCVAPLFLAIVVRATTFPAVETVFVLGAYALGLGGLLLGATVAIAVGHGALVERFTRHRRTLTRLAGVALVLAGVAQLVSVL